MRADAPDFTRIDVSDALFAGCRFAGTEVEADLILRGAYVVPDFHGMLYSTHLDRGGRRSCRRCDGWPRGGIVFAAGRAGTVQEVFQAVTKAFYASDGASGPFVFVDTGFWTRTLPVETLLRPLLAGSRHGDLATLVHVTDDVDEVVDLLVGEGAPAAAKETQHVTP